MEKLFSIVEAAELLGVSPSFLNKARMLGSGPVYVKIGRNVGYASRDLEAYVESRKTAHTAQNAA